MITKTEAMKRVAKKRMFLSMIDRDRLTELLNEAYQEGRKDAERASRVKARQNFVRGSLMKAQALFNSTLSAARVLIGPKSTASKQNSKQGKSK